MNLRSFLFLTLCTINAASAMNDDLSTLNQLLGIDEKTSKLFRACCEGDLDEIKRLVKTPQDANKTDKTGMPVLLIAVLECQKEIVEYLISKGADVNRRLATYNTVLMYACMNDQPEMVEFLLTKGADPNLTIPNGENALYMARTRGFKKTVKILLNHGAQKAQLVDPPATVANFNTSQLRKNVRFNSQGDILFTTPTISQATQSKIDDYITRECATCKGTAHLQKCADCLKVFYCGRTCQKKDWKKHKTVCNKTSTK